MAIDPGIIEIIENPDPDVIEIVDGGVNVLELTDAGITPGPQGEPGPGAADPESGTVIRNDDGNAVQIIMDTKTITITRTDGQISSITDETTTWTFARNPDGSIASWEVT
jgi:hypothetical protein